MRLSVLRPAFVAASVAWALVLPLVSFVAGRPHASRASAAVVVALYGVGRLICHQLPERSYRLFGAQMPVCARCTGIYVGAAIAALIASGARGFQPSVRAVGRSPERLALKRPELSVQRLRLVLLAAATPSALTLVFE